MSALAGSLFVLWAFGASGMLAAAVREEPGGSPLAWFYLAILWPISMPIVFWATAFTGGDPPIRRRKH